MCVCSSTCVCSCAHACASACLYVFRTRGHAFSLPPDKSLHVRCCVYVFVHVHAPGYVIKATMVAIASV